MATITPSVTRVGQYTEVLHYADVKQGDTCAPVSDNYGHDRTVHVEGTFGGATLAIKGSNRADAGAPLALNDPQGNALTFTAARIEAVLEAVRFLVPEVSGGDGTTNIQIHILCRSTQR